MDKERTAEWLLRRVVNRERAAEFVGDWVESHPGGGLLRFWSSMGWLIWIFSWRMIVGLSVSPVAGVLIGWTAFAMTLTHLHPPDSLYQGNMAIAQVRFLGFSTLVWGGAAFSLVRFGRRDALTVLTTLAAILSSAIACFFWMPYGVAGLCAGAFGLLLLGSSSDRRRRASGVLAITLLSGWMTAQFLFTTPVQPKGASNVLPLWLCVLLITVVEGGAASYFHKKLVATPGRHGNSAENRSGQLSSSR